MHLHIVLLDILSKRTFSYLKQFQELALENIMLYVGHHQAMSMLGGVRV